MKDRNPMARGLVIAAAFSLLVAACGAMYVKIAPVGLLAAFLAILLFVHLAATSDQA